MATLLESKLTPEQHVLIKKVLVAQTESLGMLEIPLVADQLTKRRHRTILDIGCGEGSFLLRLAKETRGVRYLGIDHSEPIIADARRRARHLGMRNVEFKAAFFDGSFERTTYDAATTRYTLQHSSTPEAFVKAVYRRLKKHGTFIAMESLDTYSDCRVHDDVWERYKTSVRAIHARAGSNPEIGKSLGALLRGAGFRNIRVNVLLCSPSTVGWRRFRAVVKGSSELAHTLFPDLFPDDLLRDVQQWLADRRSTEQKDPYLCSAVAAAVKA